jgi:hypothetical protein
MLGLAHSVVIEHLANSCSWVLGIGVRTVFLCCETVNLLPLYLPVDICCMLPGDERGVPKNGTRRRAVPGLARDERPLFSSVSRSMEAAWQYYLLLCDLDPGYHDLSRKELQHLI